MSANNRAAVIGKLHAALKKHYKVAPAQPTRPLLEHVLYASLLQDCPTELADEGMAKCEQDFFDWNEVRVTTVTELSQVLSRLPEPAKAASRLKQNLQAIFELFYTFDLDHLKKENLGKAVSKFQKMPSMTPFVLNYTVQHGLGGHAIPIDYSAMVVLLVTDIASQKEANSGKVPGLERAIPKSKAIEFSALLHDAAVALNANPKDKTGRAFLESVVKGASTGLDEWLASKKAAKRRAVKRKVEEKAEAEARAKAAAEAAKAPPVKKVSKKAAEAAAKKAAAAKQAAAKEAAAKKEAAKKEAAKKEAAKKVAAKKEAAAKAKAAAAAKKAAAKKPAKKASKAKGAVKKRATKKAKAPTKKKTAAAAKKKKSAPKKKPVKKSTASRSKTPTGRKLTKRKPR